MWVKQEEVIHSRANRGEDTDIHPVCLGAEGMKEEDSRSGGNMQVTSEGSHREKVMAIWRRAPWALGAHF